MSNKAVVRLQAKYRPVSGDIIGFRLQAAIPNSAARRMVHTSKGLRATDEEVPAFRRPYLIDESMDYARPDVVTEADVERFANKLKWAGYTEYEFIDAGDDPSRQRLMNDFNILSK